MLRLNQVGTYTYYVDGTINEKAISVRVVVTKKGNIKAWIGTGSLEFKKEVGEFLFSKGLINQQAYELC